MSHPTDAIVLLHADPTRTALDTACLSENLPLDVASDQSRMFDKLNAGADTVIIDSNTVDVAECRRVLGRLTDRDVAVILLTAADPGPELLQFGVDAHLSAPVDAETLVRTVERLRERDAAKPADWTAHDHSHNDPDDRSRGSVPAEPIYRRYPREFYGLWFLAAATYGFGDVVSTVLAVFTDPGLVESNPVVSVVLAGYGLPGFLVVKLVILVTLLWISVGGARSSDRLTYYWPPIVATALGSTLTGWNLWLLYGGG